MGAPTRRRRSVRKDSATAGGIISINQSNIPFSINAPGSYKLTSDLVESNSEVSPITIAVPGVTIDLNGFSISGGFDGINGRNAYLVTIQNGQVSGGLDGGIVVGHSSHISNVRAFGTGGRRFRARDDSTSDTATHADPAGDLPASRLPLLARALTAGRLRWR